MGDSSGGLAKLVGWLTQAQTLLAAVIALVALLPRLFPESFRDRLAWVPWLGLAIAVLAGLWLARSAYRSWTTRPPTPLEVSPADGTVHIRGPRPFEDGDKLLGRDPETNDLFSKVRALEFRWGYVSGEAGAGKTSLIRAGLTRRFREHLPDWTLIYLPRTGQRPDQEIAARLVDALSLPLPGDAALADIAAAAAAQPPTTLIVCDQFEEFFLSARTGEVRDAVVASLGSLWEAGRKTGKLRLLFSLRKEFVDDLNALGAAMPGLRFDEQSQLRLANLAVDVAKQMVDRIAEQGELPISRQLRPRLAADLSVDGRVRPVELQIVLSRMLAQGIYDLPAYTARGGAQGIISRYIAETIEPPDRHVDEIDRQVGRHLLRTLCADNFAARRPVGLSAAELHARIHQQLAAAAGGTPFPAGKIRVSLQRVLDEFQRARVVIEEDEDRFNLAHDYLAAPVRDATADIETAEERANRLLQHYVAQSRAEKGSVVPFRPLRQILLYSSREERERTDARALIRRSKRRLAVLGAAAAAILLAGGLTATQPSGWQLRPGPGTADRLLQLAPNRDLALIERDGRTQLVRLREPGAPATVLPVGAANGRFSPGGDMLIFPVGPDVYLAERRAGFRPNRLFENGAWPAELPISRWVGFSANGQVGFVSLRDGRVYAVHAGRPPILVARANVSPRLPFSQLAPRLRLSPSGRYLAMEDYGRRLRIFRTDWNQGPSVATVGPLALFSDIFDFSRDDSHFAWLDMNGVVKMAPTLGGAPVETVIRPAPGSVLEAVFFAPRSDLLLARDFTMNMYAHRLDDPEPPPPAFAMVGDSIGEEQPLPSFNEAGDAILGVYDKGHVYIWELASPRTAGRPRLLEAPAANSQTGIFCRGRGVALLVGRNGMLYRVHYGGGGDGAAEPIQQLPPAPSILRSRTGDGVVIFGRGYVASGACSRGAFLLTQVNAEPTDVFVGSDPRELMVATSSGLLPVRETFLLWGIPLFDRQWPLLEADAR